MSEKIEELQVIKAETGWVNSAAALDIIRKQPVTTAPRYPYLSVQPETAVAIRCLDEPREGTAKDGRELLFVDCELLEPAKVYSKEKGEFVADKGTKVSINLKRHAALERMFKRFLPCKGKELVIANLGKRTFKTPKAPRGKATGYDYRIMLLEDLKKLMGRK